MGELDEERQRLADAARLEEARISNEAVGATGPSRVDSLIAEFLDAAAGRSTTFTTVAKRPCDGWYLVGPPADSNWYEPLPHSVSVVASDEGLVPPRAGLFLTITGQLQRHRMFPNGNVVQDLMWPPQDGGNRLRTFLAFTLEQIEAGRVQRDWVYAEPPNADSALSSSLPASTSAAPMPDMAVQDQGMTLLGSFPANHYDEALMAAARIYRRHPTTEELHDAQAEAGRRADRLRKDKVLADLEAKRALVREAEWAERRKRSTGRTRSRIKHAAGAIEWAVRRTADLLPSRLPPNHPLVERPHGFRSTLSPYIESPLAVMVWDLNLRLTHPRTTIPQGRDVRDGNDDETYQAYLTPEGKLATVHQGNAHPQIWEARKFVERFGPIPEDLQAEVVDACGRLLGHWGF